MKLDREDAIAGSVLGLISDEWLMARHNRYNRHKEWLVRPPILTTSYEFMSYLSKSFRNPGILEDEFQNASNPNIS